MSRKAGSTAVASTPAACAVLLIGYALRALAGAHGEDRDLAQQGTVLPAAAITATPDASSAERRMVRRLTARVGWLAPG